MVRIIVADHLGKRLAFSRKSDAGPDPAPGEIAINNVTVLTERKRTKKKEANTTMLIY
jgi:hypothetical protein